MTIAALDREKSNVFQDHRAWPVILILSPKSAKWIRIVGIRSYESCGDNSKHASQVQ